MQKCFVGNSDIEVSRMGLGTVKFGRNVSVKYSAAFSLPTDAEIANLLAIAAESGINLLDTAPAYGESEMRLGKCLQAYPRQDWVICTKVGEEFIEGRSDYDFSSQAVVQSIERSLQRLKTDYLDIVLVHSNGEDQRIIEQENIFATLQSLKREGKIRLFGMSTKTRAGGLLALDLSDLAMITFNPAYEEERDLIAYAHKKQKGIFIKKALDSGHLCSSITDNIKFIFAEPGVTSIVVGTINPDHLRENIAAIKAVLL